MTKYRQQWFLAVGLCCVAFFLILPFIDGRLSPLAENMQDSGYILTITSEMIHGRVLYSDIFSPYGVVPHSIYKVIAICFRNTPLSYLGYITILSSVAIALQYLVIRLFLG